ncbi:hypothetical protein CMI37_33060 [Candidatus Pacearchaeota archaeon]|nr:hypothetical protein [Candidatus Pacearchaeota archaeon]|tara:strand:- start:4572 stop:5606 length:1035 start_codon:yes stop_codon:yes gene_type:complete
MLTQTELTQIREALEQSQNPLFFFDNDVDGLCSFLILQRALGRGKGVAVKSFPELNAQYLRKINELNPDAVFILDKPQVGADFIEGVEEKNLPLIWIDHHEVKIPKKLLEKISYYNSFPTSEPVTYLSQKVFNREQDLWLAMIGCIGDVYMPDFGEQFSKQNPELFPNPQTPAFDSIYTTELGKIIQMLNFGLKDTTTNVLRLIKLLIKAKSPHDILEENYHTRPLHKRFNEINKTYQQLLSKAKAQIKKDEKIIFFTYAGETSISAEIANELFFRNKNKFIVVAYKRPEKINISIRGQNAKKITEKAVNQIEGARGGGHEVATGAQIPSDKWEDFKEILKKLV